VELCKKKPQTVKMAVGARGEEHRVLYDASSMLPRSTSLKPLKRTATDLKTKKQRPWDVSRHARSEHDREACHEEKKKEPRHALSVGQERPICN